ncbi:MAG TPA: tetratricopeptide repeat protein [Blastocatellia bacterium]|nr:tetratricopeptide repeat protein [Blastocatellia bacterium]
MKDFFISYNKADKSWAEWIAWTLEESGYSVVIQAWDFRPGSNFALQMDQAASGTRKTIAVLSQSYLDAEYTQPEWAAAFTRDPKGEERALIPIRVQPFNATGLLAPIIYIDLVGLSEKQARDTILEGLKDRAKPNEAPNFPGLNERTSKSISERVIPNPVEFPGSTTAQNSSEEPYSEIPWNVPQVVQFFTGREDVLNKLHEALIEGKAAVLAQRQAISGLGGIGKTQTAIAYANQYRADYRAVFWVVAESRESLISDFVAIASLLNLPERNIQDQSLVVSAVKRWLEANRDWLLILDNADEPTLVDEFLPSGSNGHILLTSRAQVFDSIGITNPIEMEEMSPEDAREFLLRRTGRRNLENDEDKAIDELAREVDYLPLALEQAGAYIKELRASFQDYLVSYRKRGLELLERGSPTGKNRKSVRTTWSLNFQQVEDTSKAAADLLRVSAFLSPDKIPYEFISMGASELGPELSSALADVDSDPLLLDEVLNPLIRYSLIHRDRKSKTYDIHRLVQAVLKEGMSNEDKRQWAERNVNAMARVLPEVDLNDLSMLDQIERILPHVQVCSEHIVKWRVVSLEAAQLLNNTGRYLHFRARLKDAEHLYNRSLEIRQSLLDADHSEIASSLHNMAWLHYDQGRYSEAEPLYLRSLSIRAQAIDPNHFDISTSLYKLGALYIEMSRYAEAEPLIARSLELRERLLGHEHLDVVNVLIVQANLFYDLYKDTEAEELLMRSLEAIEKTLGPEHNKVAGILNSLALLYRRSGRLDEAEALNLRSRSIDEKIHGANYPFVATSLNNLGALYMDMHKYAEAEALITRSLEIREKTLGQEHPDTLNSLHTLARLRSTQGRFAEAEELYSKSLSLAEAVLGQEHISVANTLYGFALLYKELRKPYKGEPLIRRALSIRKKIFGPEHPRVVEAMAVQAEILKAMNRKGEAQRIEAQAKKIQSKLHRKSKK